MDPRHPELVLPRIKELIKQYERVEKDISVASTSAKLAQLEREGSLVVQEVCLVAPRLHEALIQTSRNSRKTLSNVYVQPVEEPKTETYVAPNQAEVYIAEPKPRKKKKTTKKKAE